MDALLAILLSLILLKRGVIGVIQLIYLYMIRTLMNSTFDLGESTVLSHICNTF